MFQYVSLNALSFNLALVTIFIDLNNVEIKLYLTLWDISIRIWKNIYSTEMNCDWEYNEILYHISVVY